MIILVDVMVVALIKVEAHRTTVGANHPLHVLVVIILVVVMVVALVMALTATGHPLPCTGHPLPRLASGPQPVPADLTTILGLIIYHWKGNFETFPTAYYSLRDSKNCGCYTSMKLQQRQT